MPFLVRSMYIPSPYSKRTDVPPSFCIGVHFNMPEVSFNELIEYHQEGVQVKLSQALLQAILLLFCQVHHEVSGNCVKWLLKDGWGESKERY